MTSRKQTPPGPQKEQIILGSLLPFGKFPLEFFKQLVQYGDISSFRLLHIPCYFVNHPDFIQRILQNPDIYSKDTIDFRIFRRVLGNGLFTSQGEAWHKQRQLMLPLFHSRQVIQFGDLMTRAIEDRIASWQDNEILDLWEEMRQLTIRVVGEALLGTDPTQASVGKHFEAIEKYIVDLFQIPLVLPMWIPIPQNRQLIAAQQALYPLIDELTAERKKEPKNDLLTMLIDAGMTNQQIRDEVITLLFAGHQTTAATLNWIWYLLTEYPQMEERLHHEVDATLKGPATVTDLPNLPYTRMLVDEVLRLWPPAFFTNRWVKQDDQIGPYHIKKGSIVFLSMYTIHRHPSYWNDPEAFDPERFSSEATSVRPHYTYIPFGGGQHRCLGESFAKTELCLAVASIAKRYQLQIDPSHQIVVEPTPALRPNHLYMRLKERA